MLKSITRVGLALLRPSLAWSRPRRWRAGWCLPNGWGGDWFWPFLAAASASVFLVVRAGAKERFSFFEPIQPAHRLEVIAHRGAAAQAPENSRPALLRCIEDGFEWAEVDVCLTKDHRHVLAHGTNLLAGSDQSLAVSQHLLSELQKIDCGTVFAAKYAGEHLLTLAEGLALAKGRLNLFLSCEDVDPELLVREVLDAGMERQVVLYDSGSHLGRFRDVVHGQMALMSKWHPDLEIQSWVASNQLAAVEIDADEITPEIARSFHALGVKVEVKVLGDLDRPQFWDKSARVGADWLQTDLPEEVRAHALWQALPHRPVQFSLHRGANRYAPENTLPAFEKAIRLGADFVEFDVRTTSDGKFFLIHDGKLGNKTNGRGLISSTPSSVIQRLSAGSKFGGAYATVGLPSLDQFLTRVEGQVNLYLDAKAIAPEALAEAVERHQMVERTVVYQSIPYLLRLKAINPHIRSLAPLRSPEQLPVLTEKIIPYAVDAEWNILSKELISRCHALGIRVFSDALGEHEQVQDYLQAMDWGIDLIQTDQPMKLLRAIELRNGSTSP